MTPETARDAIVQVAQGNEGALAALYDHFSALVFTIGLRITNDYAVAEEVLQDVFFAVWRTAGGFQPEGSAAAWIIGIARHRAIDATRARNFRARAREWGLAPVLEIAGGEQPDMQAERRLIGAQVRTALAQLPPIQREALELAYYGGLSQAEIAGRMGAPLGTTKTRMRLGLLHLRRELAESVPEYA